MGQWVVEISVQNVGVSLCCLCCDVGGLGNLCDDAARDASICHNLECSWIWTPPPSLICDFKNEPFVCRDADESGTPDAIEVWESVWEEMCSGVD